MIQATHSPPTNGESGTRYELVRPQFSTSAFNPTELSAAAQRQRLLAALRVGPVSTISARRDLAVMHPGMRVCELRKLGYSIETLWSRESDQLGVEHRQAKYVLMPTAQIGGA